ncbi:MULTISPECIES: hypothetical protein [Stenotrophomonas]|uniref:hypothetical protein n=1 Tax=Stenotrophomonas TaxID=40323 RepID=UPI0021C5C212|nr:MULTISPECIES: hypothetical protein [Stenotrophomonas]MCU1136748.1 hypothetical protein [Stenotrophomonas maltophilia]
MRNPVVSILLCLLSVAILTVVVFAIGMLALPSVTGQPIAFDDVEGWLYSLFTAGVIVAASAAVLNVGAR